MTSNASSDAGTLGSGPSGMRSCQRPRVRPAVGGSRNRPRASYLPNTNVLQSEDGTRDAPQERPHSADALKGGWAV